MRLAFRELTMLVIGRCPFRQATYHCIFIAKL